MPKQRYYALIALAASLSTSAAAIDPHFRVYEGRTYGKFRTAERRSVESPRSPVRVWTTQPTRTNIDGPMVSFGDESGKSAKPQLRSELPDGVTKLTVKGITYYQADGVTYRPYYYNGEVAYVVEEPPDVPNAGSTPPSRKAMSSTAAYSLDDVPAPEGRGYSLSPPPTGAIVPNLPEDPHPVQIGNLTYYAAAGAWYLPTNRNGRAVYVVVDEPSRGSLQR